MRRVLTGSDGPHEFPGHSGVDEVIVRAQTRLHKHQHDQQSQTKQAQDHVTYSGLWDLVKSVINLQEELLGNIPDSQNILQRGAAEKATD